MLVKSESLSCTIKRVECFLFLSDGRVELRGGVISNGSPCIVFDFWVVRGEDTSAGVMAGELVGVTFEGKEGVFSSIPCLILELLMALWSVRLIC